MRSQGVSEVLRTFQRDLSAFRGVLVALHKYSSGFRRYQERPLATLLKHPETCLKPPLEVPLKLREPP